MKEQIIATRSLIVEAGGEHSGELLEDIERRLENAQVVDDTRWGVRDVVVGRGWFSPAQSWLVIEHRRLKDVRHYVRWRPFGVHLVIVQLTTIEPPLWKRGAASLLRAGAWWSWSIPGGTLAEENLRSWLTVVGHVIQSAARDLARRVARGRGIGQLEPDVLARW